MGRKKHIINNAMSRREMLSVCKGGFGALAFTSLYGKAKAANKSLQDPKSILTQLGQVPNHAPKAKNVIFLYMDGGPSQVDTFDYKPRLEAENGEDPRSKFKVEKTQFGNIGKILKSPWDFKQYGDCGMHVSDLFPHIATCVDDIALIKSMTSKFPEHTNANYFLHTGSGLQGRPSMGSWINYGLGSDNQNIPGYVVLDGGLIPVGGLDNFNSGFLPASYQASVLKANANPVANINPTEKASGLQEQKLSFIKQMDESLLGGLGQADAVESAISNYELAYRMQTSIPELTEFKKESKATLDLYGFNAKYPQTRAYAAQCLMARRLVERGVRFIELTCPRVSGDRWDQHSGLKEGHENNARAVDQPIAGLLKDLKSRGLLEETLIVWTGEFGRTPFAQGKNGRDHNPQAFSMWMAGAGIKGGVQFGRTDDYGYKVVENKVDIHDMHATILHLLGINHEKLRFRFGGRDIRLTDVHGHVIHDILS